MTEPPPEYQVIAPDAQLTDVYHGLEQRFAEINREFNEEKAKFSADAEVKINDIRKQLKAAHDAVDARRVTALNKYIDLILAVPQKPDETFFDRLFARYLRFT